MFKLQKFITKIMRTFLFILCVMLLVSCGEEKKPQNSRTLEGLKGPVKTVKQYKSPLVEKFGEIVPGKDTTFRYIEFTPEGYYIRSTSIGDKRDYVYKFEFDVNGNVLKEERYWNDTRYYIWTGKYDDQNREFESIRIDSNGIYKWISTYDGKRIKEYDIYRNDVLIGKKKYQYSSSNNYAIFSYDKEGVLEGKVEYVSKNGFCTLYKTYDENGEIIYNTSYEYNKFNDVTEHIFRFGKEGDIDQYKYEYKYDEQGNWIEQREFLNNKPNFITTRIITYYD